jgi:uncharacterized protein (TIRG00374 family)
MKRTTTKQGETPVWVRMLPGLLVNAVAVIALAFFVDLEDLGSALGELDYSVLPLAILLFMGTVFSRAMAWRTTLKEQASLKDTFFVLNQGYLLNNILPFRLGEIGRAVLLAGRIGKSFWQVLSSIVIERVFDLGIAAGLLLGTLPLVIGAEWARSGAIVAAALVLVGFAVLFLMASQPAATERLVTALTKPWPRLQSLVSSQLAHFLEGLSALKDWRRFLHVMFWMLLTWLFNVVWYYVLLKSFFPEVTWLWALFSIAVSSIGVALPSSPAYIGVLEAAMVGSLSLFGADETTALAYAVVAHILYILLTGVLGVVGFWQQGQSLGDVYRQLRSRSTAK